jgi:5,10-methylenetetrahydromethanopterin reductase
MEIAVRVPPCVPVREYVDVVRRMEAGGIDRVAVPDSQLLWRDVWATLGACAMATTDIQLSIAVTNPSTRHASVTAGAARTLAELAPGRFHVAVGAGDSAVTSIGQRPARNAALEQMVDNARALVRGESIDDPVEPWRLRSPVRVPIFIAANGPLNLASAGRVADGVVITGSDWRRDLGIARQAATDVGRDPDELDFVVTRPCVVTTDPERDARYFMPYCLRMAQSGGAALFEQFGIHFDVPPPDPALGDLGHPENWDALVEIAQQWVPIEAALWFARNRTLFGSAIEVADQISELEAAGVRRLALAHTGAFTLPLPLIAALIDEILPRICTTTKAAAT